MLHVSNRVSYSKQRVKCLNRAGNPVSIRHLRFYPNARGILIYYPSCSASCIAVPHNKPVNWLSFPKLIMEMATGYGQRPCYPLLRMRDGPALMDWVHHAGGAVSLGWTVFLYH